MPRMHCMGKSLEIPPNGKICPNYPSSMVKLGYKCLITCNSGTPNVESIKCEAEGWTVSEVYCSGNSTGLIVGLLVGGLIVVCLIAYIYAKVKSKNKNKAEAAVTGAKNQPMTRAAKIAARNDMMVTGVVTSQAIKSGVVRQAPTKTSGKLVTALPDETNGYRHHSASSQQSNPPSYHSNDPQEERTRNSTGSTKSSKSRRTQNSNTDHSHSQRKHRPYYDEYTEEVDLGFQHSLPPPTMDGQYHSVQDNGPMYPDYYGPGNHRVDQRYGALDHNYYARDVGSYPDHYLNGVENMAYGHSDQYHEKPYRVPI